MPNIKFSTLLTLILVAFVTVMGILTTYYIDRYQSIRDHSKSLILDQAFNQLSYSYREFLDTRDQLFSVTQLLARSQNLHDYTRKPTDEQKSLLENIWSSALANQKWFSAIRFIDREGQESIRVDYSLVNQRVKVSHIYFQHFTQAQLAQAREQNANDIFIQKMSLPVSRNKNSPLAPQFSLITPVILNGEHAGYLAINLDLTHLLTRLSYSPNVQFRPSFVSREGYFLDSANLSSVTNLIEQNQTVFSNSFPQTWQLMQNQESAYSAENNTLNIFSRVMFTSSDHYYLLISLPEEEVLNSSAAAISDLTTEAITAGFVALLFLFPMIFFAFYVHKKGIDSKLARAALEGSSAMIISDHSHRILTVNNAFEKMTSLSRRIIRGKNPLKLLLSHYGIEFILDISERLVDTHLWEGEVELTNSLGLPITVWMRIQAVEEHGAISYYIITLMDISERKELENRLRELSERDSLTSLWNRGKFESELMSQCQLVERYPETHAVCLAILDIDHFKRVNDQKGHDQGDLVIIGVSDILIQLSRNTDFVARIGGEEYGLILPHTRLDDAEHFLRRLCRKVEQTLNLGVTISAGVTDLSADPRRSYKCADIALYEAKTQGRNQVCVCKNSDDIA